MEGGGLPASKQGLRGLGRRGRGPHCHHPRQKSSRECYPSLRGPNALEHQREDSPPPIPPIPGQSNGGCCLGSGSVSSGREGRWGAGQVSPGTRLTASGHSGWGVGGALWGWCCRGSVQGQCGRGCPRPWRGRTPPPPKAHHPEAAAAAAAATASVAQGPARPWLGGRPAGQTDRSTTVAVQPAAAPGTRSATRAFAPPRRVPGTPPRGREESEAWAGRVGRRRGRWDLRGRLLLPETPAAQPSPPGPQPERGLRGNGPQHPSARVARGRRPLAAPRAPHVPCGFSLSSPRAT